MFRGFVPVLLKGSSSDSTLLMSARFTDYLSATLLAWILPVAIKLGRFLAGAVPPACWCTTMN
jgi:hypothetical protein